MNKKIIIIIISIFILLLTLSLIIIGGKREFKDRQFSVAVDKNKQDFINLNSSILSAYNYFENGNSLLHINNTNNYLDFIQNDFSQIDDNNNIYFTVFSSQVLEILRESNNTYLLNRNQKLGIPDVFTTLSRLEKYSMYTPISWSPWGMYYNKTVFDQLNLKEPKTIKELEHICKVLIDNDITPFSMVENVKWPLTTWFDYLDIRTNGDSFHNGLLSGLYDFTDDRVSNIFNEIYRMVNSGYFSINNENDWKYMIVELGEGSTGMLLGGSFYFEEATLIEKENFGWFPFPLINENDEYSEIVTTAGYIINKNSTNINELKKFIEFSSNIEVQNIVMKNSSLYPINEEIIDSYNREDLKEGFEHITNSTRILPSFERNNSTILYQYIKNSLNLLFKIESKDDISTILEQLEIERKKIN